MHSIEKHFLVPPGTVVSLKKFDPRDKGGLKDKEEAHRRLAEYLEELDELQYRLYAENRRALLLIFQGMDASGKDGVIRRITTGFDPHGFTVTSFKQPSEEELAHDFLWRIHRAVPGRGRIGIFNRSHYEDVLVVRVRGLVPKEIWSARYDQINAFERHLSENGITLLKFFLHISKDEQKLRLQERLADPRKQWKFSLQDIEERQRWPQYMAAYEEALSRCSTSWAPWFVVPADRKWVRDVVVARIVLETLRRMDPRCPAPTLDVRGVAIP